MTSTNSLTFNQVVQGLKDLRYKVNITPQEKLAQNELVVTMDDIDIIDETSLTYQMTVTIAIAWNTQDPSTITTDVANMIATLDEIISQPTFKFGKPRIELTGQEYRIFVYCQYYEIVTLGE